MCLTSVNNTYDSFTQSPGPAYTILIVVEAPGCKSKLDGDTWNGTSAVSSVRLISQLPDIVPVFFTVIFVGSENSHHRL